MCMAVIDHAATSRNTTKHIHFVTHHSVSSHTIRRHSQQSGMPARSPLLLLPLTGNQKSLRHQWCDDRRTWKTEWSDIVFTDESRFCLQYHDGRIRVWRHRGERLLNCCVMHHHTGPSPVIVIWDGIGLHCRTPVVHIGSTLNS
ncbi:transposable element Tc3 transposase [Trichonephila clavipes]|uniref:Transposable element Tc3 transposase n=1 Tax=Trichonephila clavipes TaxID=2585209 RepID=A0A8X6VQC4_TRICX|nr:transposable element Tc3 transposase [Trichonephila clavipes]